LKSETGKVTGLLGRNGTGKSCLMKIIFGELTSKEKSIRINNAPILNKHRNPQDMKYLPQFHFIPYSFPVKRIFDDFQVDFSAFTNDFPDFGKFYNSKIKHLSGGEKRIIEIYAILASDTKFCLLDEPFSHIMPIHIEKVIELITKHKNNKGIILTDHMYKYIIGMCDDLYVIKDGKVHLTQSPQDIEKLGYAHIVP